MLDVLLVLLITFMAISIRMRHTIDAQLSQPCVGKCAQGTPIVLEVFAGPAYRINRTPIAANALLQELEKIYDGRRDKVLQVAGHAGARYQDVISAMDVAKSAGVRAIGVPPKDSDASR